MPADLLSSTSSAIKLLWYHRTTWRQSHCNRQANGAKSRPLHDAHTRQGSRAEIIDESPMYLAGGARFGIRVQLEVLHLSLKLLVLAQQQVGVRSTDLLLENRHPSRFPCHLGIPWQSICRRSKPSAPNQPQHRADKNGTPEKQKKETQHPPRRASVCREYGIRGNLIRTLVRRAWLCASYFEDGWA